MATVKCPLHHRGKPTHEWNDGVKDRIYCMGYVDNMTDSELPECLSCPDHVSHAQDDLDAFYGRNGKSMTTEEAIQIIQRGAAEADARRPKDAKGYVFGAIADACKMALDALRAQQERENPEPLTLEQLRDMPGEPVYIVLLYENNSWWIVIRGVNGRKLTADYGGWFDLKDYGETWIAYRQKPKEGKPKC